MKIKILFLLLSLVLFSFGLSYGQSLSFEAVETGLYNTDSIIADGVTLTKFTIRMTNDAGVVFAGIANGFRIYSPDGATWNTTVADTLPLGWPLMFPLVFAINTFSIDGMGADTVGFGGARMLTAGLPIGFDEVSYTITIGPIATTDNEKTICLDSSFYRPTGSWAWAYTTSGSVKPAWETAPQCFTVVDTVLLGIESLGGLPEAFALTQNYPNPFNPTTDIKFDVPARSNVSIEIYNVLGQKVVTLVNEEKEAGSYVVDWDGNNEAGVQVSTGIYFYKMTAGNFTETKKMVMIK